MQSSTREKGPDHSVDPICGMVVSNTSEFSVVLNGDQYFFCCEPCAQKFTGNTNYCLEHHPTAAAMSLSSVSIITNALRLRKMKIQGLSSARKNYACKVVYG